MNKQILRLAIPNIISNISIPLLSSVDTALVGRMEEVYYLGALAVAGMIFNVLYWGFGFLRMGTTGLTAIAFGASDKKQLSSVLYRAMITATLASIGIVVLQVLILKLALLIVPASPEVQEYASIYFLIRIWDAPAVLALFVIQGWFLGMQNAKYPMYITIFINILNILLNVYFIYGLGMRVEGVAYGTVIAQYCGLILALFLLFKTYSKYIVRISKNQILQAEALLKFFRVSRDIFIRTLCLIFTFAFFTIQSAAFGDEILAVNTILLQFWHILSYGVDGFAYAAESISGRLIGGRKKEEFKKAVKYLIGWGMAFGVILSLMYYLFQNELLLIYTDNPEVLALAKAFMIWTIMAPLINSFCFIWDGIYIGATATAPMRNSMIISSFIIYLPVFYILAPFYGNHALWIAMLAYMISRGVTLLVFAKKHLFGSHVFGKT